MAEEKKKKKKGGGKIRKEYNKIGREFTRADELANRLGIAPNDDKLDISREEGFADPNSSSFVGGRSDQTKNYIEGLQHQVENAGKRSEELRSVMSLMQGGLAGLNSQENQALRETAQQEMNRSYQGAVRKLSEAQVKGNVMGASRTAQMANEGRALQDRKGEFERDLMVKNIDIQDKRRKDYLGAVTGAENDEWTRTKTALDDYGSAVQGAEQSEYQKTQLAQGHLQDLRGQNIAYANTGKAAKLANMLGITGFGMAKKDADRQYELGKEGLDVQREQIAAGKEMNSNYLAALNNMYSQQGGDQPSI